MEVGDWITLGAVLVAIGIGVASILHTRSMQKRERRERLLNEIIDWVTEVLMVGRNIEIILKNLPRETIVEMDFREFNNIVRKGKSIRYISRTINKELGDATDKLINLIVQHVKLMRLDWKGKIKNHKSVEKLRAKVDIAATNVIELAVKIKVEDIS